MTAICLETFVLFRSKVVHEDPKSVKLGLLNGIRKKEWNRNALEVVFGLALPRELSRVVVVSHRRKEFVLSFSFLFHCAYRPLCTRMRGCSGARTSHWHICSGGDRGWDGRGDGGCCYLLCPLNWGSYNRTCSDTRRGTGNRRDVGG